jgi:oxygen-independent coproporphyrinogen-3 oxidase
LRTTEGAVRYRNHATPRAYLDAARLVGRGDRALRGGRDGQEAPLAGDSGFDASQEHLDPDTLLRERIMLGLRMKDGFDLEAAAREVGAEPYSNDRRAALAKLEERGRIVRHGARIAVPRAAWIWVDDTAAALF